MKFLRSIRANKTERDRKRRFNRMNSWDKRLNGKASSADENVRRLWKMTQDIGRTVTKLVDKHNSVAVSWLGKAVKAEDGKAGGA